MSTGTARLTRKFQITIPAAVRRRLGLKVGDAVHLEATAGAVVLKAARGGWTEASRRMGQEVWRAAGGSDAIERERASWGSDR